MTDSNNKVQASGTETSNSGTEAGSLASLLQKQRSRPVWQRWQLWLILLLLLGAAYWFLSPGKAGGIRYVTEPVRMGELTVTATATGTIQPTKTVEVGSELSGLIESVLAQENDVVAEGQLLAVLDTAKLNDAITKSRAALASAQAQVLQNEATVAEAKAKLLRMQEVYKVSKGKVPAATEMEVAEAALKRAEANLSAAKAAVLQVEAELKTNETNLSKAQIRSPVNGVVLERKVEPGNTVVASMSAPVLFTIAEDLTKMELQVKIDEADVAMIKPGQQATFTVSAWPGRLFNAEISRVGLGSTITDNVVTYKTVLDVSNEDLALRPGMTATATVITAQRENVLLVPNAALRFKPQLESPSSAGSSSVVSRLIPFSQPRPKQQGTARGEAGSGQVWVLDNGQPKPVQVQTGLTNGRLTEITGGDLQPGAQVIVSQENLK